MTKDLEETLAGLDAGCRETILRMKAAFRDEATSPRAGGAIRFTPPKWWKGAFTRTQVAVLAAACLLVALGFATVLAPARVEKGKLASSPYAMAYSGEKSVEELVRTQRPDGGWESDYLTRQNAAALKSVQGAELAYRKALRHLRMKGLKPMSDEEFSRLKVLAAVRI